MHGFHFFITIPTRIRITLIDHIFTNMMIHVNYFESGAFFKDIIDYFPLFCILQNIRTESTDQCILKRI